MNGFYSEMVFIQIYYKNQTQCMQLMGGSHTNTLISSSMAAPSKMEKDNLLLFR